MSDDSGDNDSIIDEPPDNEADGPADDIADAENASESESYFDYSDSWEEEESDSEPMQFPDNVEAEGGDDEPDDDDAPSDEENNLIVGNNVQQNNLAAPAPVQGHQVVGPQMQEVYVEGRPCAAPGGQSERDRAYYAYVIQLLEAGFSYSRSIFTQHGSRADIYVRPMPRREE